MDDFSRRTFAIFAAALIGLAFSLEASAASIGLQCLEPGDGGAGEASVYIDANPLPDASDGENGCPDLQASAAGLRDGIALSASAAVTAINNGIQHDMFVDGGSHPDSVISQASATSDSTFIVPVNSSGVVRLELFFEVSGTTEPDTIVGLNPYQIQGLGTPVDISNLMPGWTTMDFGLNPGQEYGLIVLGGMPAGQASGAATRNLFVRLSTVPEPGTIVLLPAALALALFVRSRPDAS